MTENQIVKQLQRIAARLTSAVDLQKDLMQEMFVHFIHIRTIEPGQTLSWCLVGCESHARNYLKLGGSIDAPKRTVHDLDGDGFSVGRQHGGNNASHSAVAGQIVIQGELITNDVLNLILPVLSDKQQQVLFLLMKGCGVREAARELGITHPAVIKHRKKIARIAREFLQQSEGIGVAIAVHNGTGGNGNGSADGNGDAHQAA